MKLKNRDTNVAEMVNISKFSKLNDIGTPLRLFEYFFDDTLVEMVVSYAKFYGHREKAGTSFEITKLLMKHFAYF